MGKVFCLIGKSSSGKDTIFKQLINDHSLNLKPIVPYTTRPIRQNETQGIEYHFVCDCDIERYRKQDKIIEQRNYDTINGIWSYCTIDDGQINLKADNHYLLITTLQAFKQIQAYFGANNVLPLYIEVEDGIRLERALHREQQQETPNYNELCRRFLSDSNDFSYSNLQNYGIKNLYLNHNLNICLKEIKTQIKIFQDN